MYKSYSPYYLHTLAHMHCVLRAVIFEHEKRRIICSYGNSRRRQAVAKKKKIKSDSAHWSLSPVLLCDPDSIYDESRMNQTQLAQFILQAGPHSNKS